MCPRGSKWHFANLTWNHQRISMGVTCKRRHEDRYITITSIEWWFRNYIHNNRCFFKTYHRLSHPTTFKTSKVIIDNMSTHAYLTTLLIPEKSSTSLSHVINEVAEFIDVTHRHVTTERAKTIGVRERTHPQKRYPWNCLRTMSANNGIILYYQPFWITTKRITLALGRNLGDWFTERYTTTYSITNLV